MFFVMMFGNHGWMFNLIIIGLINLQVEKRYPLKQLNCHLNLSSLSTDKQLDA